MVHGTFFFHSAKSKGKHVAFAFKSENKIESALTTERAIKKRNKALVLKNNNFIAQNYFAFFDVPIISPFVGESRFKFDI